MASTAAKTTGGAAALVAVAAAVLLNTGPQTGLLQVCTGPDADKATTDGSFWSSCQRSWKTPGADDYVLSATKPGGKWGDADYKWRKFSTLKLNHYVESCSAKIAPGDFAPPNRPVVDAACGDPCGCNDTYKKPLLVAKYKKLLPNNGGLFTWEPPTTNTDGSPVKTPITYSLFRVTAKPAVDGVRAVDTTKPTLKQFEVTDETLRILAGQPVGEQCYAMTAKTSDGESVLTNAVCKTMSLAGPTNVGLEKPTSSGVE